MKYKLNFIMSVLIAVVFSNVIAANEIQLSRPTAKAAPAEECSESLKPPEALSRETANLAKEPEKKIEKSLEMNLGLDDLKKVSVSLDFSKVQAWRTIVEELKKGKVKFKIEERDEPRYKLLKSWVDQLDESTNTETAVLAFKVVHLVSIIDAEPEESFETEKRLMSSVVYRLGRKSLHRLGAHAIVFGHVVDQLIPEIYDKMPDTFEDEEGGSDRVKDFMKIFSWITEVHHPEYYRKMLSQILKKDGPIGFKSILALDAEKARFEFIKHRILWLKEQVLAVLAKNKTHKTLAFLKDMASSKVLDSGTQKACKGGASQFPSATVLSESEFRAYIESQLEKDGELYLRGSHLIINSTVSELGLSDKQIKRIIEQYFKDSLEYFEHVERKVIKRKRL